MSSPFRTALEALINRHSKENESNTPDYILADYLLGCLEAYDKATRERDRWYGVTLRPGQVTTEPPRCLRCGMPTLHCDCKASEPIVVPPDRPITQCRGMTTDIPPPKPRRTP